MLDSTLLKFENAQIDNLSPIIKAQIREAEEALIENNKHKVTGEPRSYYVSRMYMEGDTLVWLGAFALDNKNEEMKKEMLKYGQKTKTGPKRVVPIANYR